MDYTVFKKEFVERFAAKGSDYRDKSKIPFQEANEMVDKMLLTIQKIVANGESLTLPGFGTFNVEERAATRIRNINTGAINEMPAHNVLKFHPTEKMKQIVVNGVVR